MRSIAIELTVFIMVLVVIVFIFSFFVAWQVASIKLRLEKAEKDLNNLGESMRMNRAHVISRITRHQNKFNELVDDLNLPSKLKDYAPPDN